MAGLDAVRPPFFSFFIDASAAAELDGDDDDTSGFL